MKSSKSSPLAKPCGARAKRPVKTHVPDVDDTMEDLEGLSGIEETDEDVPTDPENDTDDDDDSNEEFALDGVESGTELGPAASAAASKKAAAPVFVRAGTSIRLDDVPYAVVDDGHHKAVKQATFVYPAQNAHYAHVQHNNIHSRAVLVGDQYHVLGPREDEAAVRALRGPKFPNMPNYRLADISNFRNTGSGTCKKLNHDEAAAFGPGLVYGSELADELRAKRKGTRAKRPATAAASTPVPTPTKRPKRDPETLFGGASSFKITGTLAGMHVDVSVTAAPPTSSAH